jgi:hypothetical protein
MKEELEKLIAKYNKQWNKYGMGSVVAYSQVVADLEKLLDNISDEEIIAETFKQQEQCKCGQQKVGGYSCQRTDCNQNL